jgi:hypothetical protein
MSHWQTQRNAALYGMSARGRVREPLAKIHHELRLFQSYYKLLETKGL